MQWLSSTELADLVKRVFNPQKTDTSLAILIDLPDNVVIDHPLWKERREIAAQWVHALQQDTSHIGLNTSFFGYRNVRANNADLPPSAWQLHPSQLPSTADDLDDGNAIPFEAIFSNNQLFIAPTQFSATAPLKLAAKQYDFRAATMPGFSKAMLSALRLDYEEINRRVSIIQELLSNADGADIEFLVEGHSAHHNLYLDLRHRLAHASGGLLRSKGIAGNLPSGEAYIVPYEGERENTPSLSKGTIPVQFGSEVIYYHIENNRAIGVTGSGPVARKETQKLLAEPAYGNIAELGLGVLTEFGLDPIGEILLDEKLGPHIAFGRSDHFGGQIGAKDFSDPGAVVHIDRVYLPQTQPLITIACLTLVANDQKQIIIKDGHYTISFE